MNRYYADSPIEMNAEDLLDRASFAQLLSQTLLNLNDTDTFTVGLFGKWGSGKTSIVKMMLQSLEQLQKEIEQSERMLVVHFEPWNVSDSNQLLSQFLVRLSNEFRQKGDKGLKKVGDALENYSDAFTLAELIPDIGLAGKIISLLGKGSFNFLGRLLKSKVDSKDIQRQKEYVIKLLQKQSNRILVIIDDIDRLSNEQIRQVFQLVTSVAKFPNTAYLLVFDKEVVVKALGKVQEGDGEDYLEKVIQMPIQVPEIPEDKLHTVLFKRLDEVLSSYPESSFSKEHWQEIFASCIAPFVSNLRDVNRLCNTLQFKMTTISSEVDFSDMVAISAIEIGCPAVYEWIKHKKDILTNAEPFYVLGQGEKTPSEWLMFYREEIAALFPIEGKTTNFEDSIDVVVTAIATLFPFFGQKIGRNYRTIDIDTFRRRALIAHSEKFDRYFYYDIDKVSLKRSDIEQVVFHFSPKEFVEFLMDNDRNDQGITVLKELKAMIAEIPSERAMLLFETLILSTDDLKTIERKSVFSVGAAAYAEHLCIELLDRVDASKRKDLLISLIENSDIEKLNTLAIFINLIELGYGRMAANGEEREYKKVITVEELEEIEVVFISRVKTLLKQANLFACSDWRMILYFLESFDKAFVEEYLKLAFVENKNVLTYLWSSVSAWIGTGRSYEINDHYKKYLSEKRILKAIQEEVASKQLFTMQEDIIFRCAAFYLDSLGKHKPDMHIPQAMIDKVVDTWKASGYVELTEQL